MEKPNPIGPNDMLMEDWTRHMYTNLMFTKIGIWLLIVIELARLILEVKK